MDLCAVEFGTDFGWSVGVVRSDAAVSASAALAIHLLYWGQALVAGSLLRLVISFVRSSLRSSYRCSGLR